MSKSKSIADKNNIPLREREREVEREREEQDAMPHDDSFSQSTSQPICLSVFPSVSPSVSE